MITAFKIENFKVLKSIELNDLRRISLISGKNNVGKSSLLEALFLYMDHLAGDSFGKLNGLRGAIGLGIEGLWEPLFYQMDTDNPILIEVIDDEKKGQLKYERDNKYLPSNISGVSEDILAQFRADTKSAYSLSCSFKEGDYSEEGHFSLNGNGVLRDFKTSLPGNEIKRMMATQFMSALLIRNYDSLVNEMGKVELAEKKQDVVKALQEMDPSIEDIVTLSVRGVTQLYIRTDGKLMPLRYAGDGIAKLLSICLAIMCQQDGIVLIDELESGFHYSMYGTLWKLIDHISRKANCQIIATTHSYELISSVRNNLHCNDDFCYYRIGKKKECATAYRYDYSMLYEALEAEMEIR